MGIVRFKLKNIWRIFFGILFGYFICFAGVAGEMHGLRGQRYCEILLGSEGGLPSSVQVYNTIGLNDCPPALWKKITPDAIKKETKVSLVHLNGPRYWVIDGFEKTVLVNPTVKTFGGIPMRDAGILQLRPLDFIRGMKPYQARPVKRETTWIYQSGKPIYEIIDQQGQAYVMQSYSTQKVEQSEATLPQLGEKLQLPKGWRFQSRVLKQDAHLTPIDKKAIVIQDDFLNTYQQETPGFISGSRG